MRIVFTGGPGSGKTTIIKELEKLGYRIIEEPARKLISHYEKNSPELHPSLSKENRYLFQTAVEKQNYKDYEENDFGFFDRSAIDEIGYRNRFDIQISDELNTFAANNRYDMVFFFPYWEEIYKNDNVRHETKKEAELVGKFILKAYINTKYNPLIVPKTKINLRLDYIINNILSKEKEKVLN